MDRMDDFAANDLEVMWMAFAEAEATSINDDARRTAEALKDEAREALRRQGVG